MNSSQWTALKKQPDKAKKMLSALHMSSAYLKVSWNELDEGDQKKVSKWFSKNGSGWFEAAVSTATPKGIKNVAPKHHKAAVKKESRGILRKPMKAECKPHPQKLQPPEEARTTVKEIDPKKREYVLLAHKTDGARVMSTTASTIDKNYTDYYRLSLLKDDKPIDGMDFHIKDDIFAKKEIEDRIEQIIKRNNLTPKEVEVKREYWNKTPKHTVEKKPPRRCTHKQTERVDKELSGGTIYQAIKCKTCGKEPGHTVHDPTAAAYLNQERRGGRPEEEQLKYVEYILRNNPIRDINNDVNIYSGRNGKDIITKGSHNISSDIWRKAWDIVAKDGEIMILDKDDRIIHTPYVFEGVIVNTKWAEPEPKKNTTQQMSWKNLSDDEKKWIEGTHAELEEYKRQQITSSDMYSKQERPIALIVELPNGKIMRLDRDNLKQYTDKTLEDIQKSHIDLIYVARKISLQSMR